MSSGGGAGEGSDAGPTAPAPSTAALAALPSDAAAWLLPHVRAALHALEPADVTPVVRRLRAAPTGRLAGGRVQRELHELLAAGGPAWRALVARVHDAAGVPPSIARLVARGEADAAPPLDPAPAPTPPATRPATRSAGEERARARLREVRAERDELRRQLAGATARTTAVEAERDQLARDLATARSRIAALEAEGAGTEAARQRAVDRERRRRDAEVARLEATVAELRRADQERLAAARRREERVKLAEQEAARAVAARRREVAASDTGRLVPGRPSRLPADVRPGTTEAADLLLHRGRRVLVDGYNVTRQHQPDLDLEGQRTWLIRLLANLAARRRVEPTVVFDGQGAASSRPAAGSREVREVFTPAGVTADDELVLAAEATDEPLVVVTDDRELTERLTATGVDVIRTQKLLDVAR